MSERPRITIVDNATPCPPPETETDDARDLAPSRKLHPRSLAKKITKSSVREGLARRKYAKWQPDRYSDMMPTGTLSTEESMSRRQTSELGGGSSQTVSRRQSRVSTEGQTDEEVEAEAELPWEDRQSEVEVLYENQRGWVCFGIPMFSDKSLLNFDPPAWMTRNNEESPVNVTNAQVPDPSWEWAWKTWYVDMSGDVDEEGWQYSFSFASNFSWHGTHPWFHSFVRRRRWLRKRVKKVLPQAGFQPTRSVEYFTVQTTSARSSVTSIGGGGRSAFGAGSGMGYEEYEGGVSPDEITNVATLCKAIKAASLDREKLDAVGEFVHRGSEELEYLAEKIPDILSMLLFQSSRRQLVDRLNGWVNEIPPNTKNQHAMRRRHHLEKALESAQRYFSGKQVWTDAKSIASSIGAMQTVPERVSESSSSSLRDSDSGQGSTR